MPEGIDVHGDKGAVDWHAVRKAGVTFAWVKDTEGRTFDDQRSRENQRQAKQAGVLVGGYHYARPDLNTARAEAEHFLRVARPVRGELLPVLDFEHAPAAAGWALEWLRIVEEAIGRRPILYTYSAFLARMGRQEELARYPLWIANYSRNDGLRHPVTVPAGFRMVAHQYTSSGTVNGVRGRVDRNWAPQLSLLVYGGRLYRIVIVGPRPVVQAARRAARAARARLRRRGTA